MVLVSHSNSRRRLRHRRPLGRGHGRGQKEEDQFDHRILHRRDRPAGRRLLGLDQGASLIRKCTEDDLDNVFHVVNDAAEAFNGVIPADCWSTPYMPMEELRAEIDDGVEFWVYEEENDLLGVMGIQDVLDVTLIRHAYVRSADRNRGIGSQLLAELRGMTSRQIMMGTWLAADWAIGFYEKHGFRCTKPDESSRLLRKYWKISDRQIETSIVLVEDPRH